MSRAAKGAAPTITEFLWRGANASGDRTQGEIRAVNAEEARSQLRKQGIHAVRLRRKPSPLFQRGGRITPMELAMVTRQIATMLLAGVPLVTTLQMIGRGHDREAMRNLLGEILLQVEAGVPLSQALRPHRQQFDELYCDLVEAGEHSGALDRVFDRIATYREKAEALKSKIKKAMFYPTAVILVALMVTVILLLFVVPQFEEIFASFNAELPLFTQWVIQLSRVLQQAWPYFACGVIGLVWGGIRAHRSSARVRDRLDALLLRLPLVGPILHKGAVARFARTLATTFAAGVPLIEGLNSAAGAAGNAVYRSAVQAVRDQVVSGLQMNMAMRTQKVFPDMLVQMVLIGEESGSLDEMLNKVANIYEMQVDDAVDGLSTLIEPLLMVVIGSLVGGLVVAMYLPIFQLGSVVG
ncbi:type II secretion system F family protein [Ferrimonas sediminicola]|uniref:Type II secretion system F family protein n=1 Tax=Ferrimonas sediminicola TaxID=2569538 RepID=A0A4U1BJE0_9GAMM|nr:type II secretion system F family protein [Ferrimonas sediminicola]TKB51285.1 type II secretion system F family protein [Ferrimonas sediminicola]